MTEGVLFRVGKSVRKSDLNRTIATVFDEEQLHNITQADAVALYGFTLAKSPPQHQGLLFKHPDGLADLSLWIMPDNRSDGALEDFITSCIIKSEEFLFRLAQKSVTALKEPKFKPTQVAKAEVATWLAWQKAPGRGPYYALQEGSIDMSCQSFLGLSDWLERLYR